MMMKLAHTVRPKKTPPYSMCAPIKFFFKVNIPKHPSIQHGPKVLGGPSISGCQCKGGRPCTVCNHTCIPFFQSDVRNFLRHTVHFMEDPQKNLLSHAVFYERSHTARPKIFTHI